ncbi:MAG TPA: hypothetical protein VEG08_07805 [Terriglobales bacterium]|nr:hypothetical protein [Terriglobales bacterium]
MKPDLLTKALLTLIVVFLGLIALHPLAVPAPAAAATPPSVYPFYIEPGTTMVRSPDGRRQVLGKVMVDMTTGNIWGFPTLNAQPYPMDSTTTEPPVSSPIYLGRYDFSAAIR